MLLLSNRNVLSSGVDMDRILQAIFEAALVALSNGITGWIAAKLGIEEDTTSWRNMSLIVSIVLGVIVFCVILLLAREIGSRI